MHLLSLPGMFGILLPFLLYLLIPVKRPQLVELHPAIVRNRALSTILTGVEVVQF